ncbi:hypothetical protein GJ496_008343 [Pomphorhynchus laevis]|nr:hypothetical protein GJ496_008343 [Pomphorhynchus laevis]
MTGTKINETDSEEEYYESFKEKVDINYLSKSNFCIERKMLTHAFSEIWNKIVPKSKTPKLQRSLSEAAETGDENSIKYWISKKGANPCEFDEYGYFPLLNASLNNRIEMVKILLVLGADVNQKGPHGYTALHAAAQNGLREIAEVLIRAGADLNPRNDDTDTPLLLATRAQQIEMIALLSKSGCDATIKGYSKESSIEIARNESLVRVAECLENQCSQRIYSEQVGSVMHSIQESEEQEIEQDTNCLMLPSIGTYFIPFIANIVYNNSKIYHLVIMPNLLKGTKPISISCFDFQLIQSAFSS